MEEELEQLKKREQNIRSCNYAREYTENDYIELVNIRNRIKELTNPARIEGLR